MNPCKFSLLSFLLLVTTVQKAETSLDAGLHVITITPGSISDLTKDGYMATTDLTQVRYQTTPGNLQDLGGTREYPTNENKELHNLDLLDISSENDTYSQIPVTTDDTRNKTKIRADKTKNFYCSPLNPCPKGYTEKDGCIENMENTANVNKKWIELQQDLGLCECDKRHMNSCPVKSLLLSDKPSQQLTAENKIDGLVQQTVVAHRVKRADNLI